MQIFALSARRVLLACSVAGGSGVGPEQCAGPTLSVLNARLIERVNAQKMAGDCRCPLPQGLNSRLFQIMESILPPWFSLRC